MKFLSIQYNVWNSGISENWVCTGLNWYKGIRRLDSIYWIVKRLTWIWFHGSTFELDNNIKEILCLLEWFLIKIF